MLELGEPQLQLLELVTPDEPELSENALETQAGPLGEARRLAAPAHDGLLDQLADVVPPHAASLGELTRELVNALCGQRDGPDRGQAQSLD
jgi:hypothetical protein